MASSLGIIREFPVGGQCGIINVRHALMAYIMTEHPPSLMVGVFCPRKAIPAIKEPDNTPIKR